MTQIKVSLERYLQCTVAVIWGERSWQVKNRSILCFVILTKCLLNISIVGCWSDTNQGAQTVAATHLSDHESSVVVMSSECKGSGPAAEVEIPASSSSKLAKQSPTVSYAGERCVNIATKGQQEGLETPESDYEVNF